MRGSLLRIVSCPQERFGDPNDDCGIVEPAYDCCVGVNNTGAAVAVQQREPDHAAIGARGVGAAVAMRLPAIGGLLHGTEANAP